MISILLLLVGLAASTSDDCVEKEFEANGRFTGQNIDMNYEDSGLLVDGDETKLRVQFYVPTRYYDQYEANSFAITFNRELKETVQNGGATFADKVALTVAEGTNDQSACYSNRYDNYTHCDIGTDLWEFQANTDNDCITDAWTVVPWSDVMADAFHGVEIKANGGFTEVFLVATVETWTHFVEGNVSDYLGVMSGAENWINTDVTDGDTNKKGEYNGDGGWNGAGDSHSGDFGNIVMDDERYTLYQIPFILRFPRTVVVETSFRVASPITVLTGVIAQDVITLDMNPTAGSGVFAVLEATLTTQVQYPYGIRSPDDNKAPMVVYRGGDSTDAGTHAKTVEFVEFDEESGCGDLSSGEVCEQTFKIRITPADATPCTVSGDYFFEFWAECVMADGGGVNGCTLDDLVENADIVERRKSNAYFSETVTISHQPFCPLLVDEVRVVGDLTVYHDESFITEIDSDDVFTNDILFYEAEYRTASASSSSQFTDFEDNDDSSPLGDDSIIDYVRATKIFMDVVLGLKRGTSDLTDGWDSTDSNANVNFAPLGGSRIPGTDEGLDGSDLVVDDTTTDGTIKYNILLCETSTIEAATIQFSKDKPTDCFAGQGPQNIATKYLDFTKIMMSKENVNGDDNEIDENEVAFAMRMDERVIPLKPNVSDNSYVTVTIQSEVYYKGNRHPTRRLLQSGPNTQRQIHSMSKSYRVHPATSLKKCNIGEDMTQGRIELEMTFDEEKAFPTAASSVDWASRFSLQLETFLEARDSISIARMEQCNEKACSTIYMEGRRSNRRRLDGEPTFVKINIKVESNKSVSAGHTMNKLQDHLVNTRSDIHTRVSAMVNAEVTAMSVPGCGETEHKPVAHRPSNDKLDWEEESSAAALSTFFASMIALWAML